MRQTVITALAIAAGYLLFVIPIAWTHAVDGLRSRIRKGNAKELGMSFGDLERMTADELTEHLRELAAQCPIDLPRYCCPIKEFRRLEPTEINGWLKLLHRHEKLAIAANHIGCAKWNARF